MIPVHFDETSRTFRRGYANVTAFVDIFGFTEPIRDGTVIYSPPDDMSALYLDD